MSDLSGLNPTPHAIAVYASSPLSPVATQHSLPSGRYSLLGPDFHRLDRTSLRLAHSFDHLVGELLPWFENRKKELANRPLIREQAFGEALDPDKLERLGRYEVHLDRKLERMLTMLLRLKDLRRPADLS